MEAHMLMCTRSYGGLNERTLLRLSKAARVRVNLEANMAPIRRKIALPPPPGPSQGALQVTPKGDILTGGVECAIPVPNPCAAGQGDVLEGATDRTSNPPLLLPYRRRKRQPCPGKLLDEGYGLAWVQTARDLRARLGFGLPRVRIRAFQQHTSSPGRRASRTA